VDGELRELLESAGAVVIEGPKACGKTMTASQQSASRVLLDSVISSTHRWLWRPAGLLRSDCSRILSGSGSCSNHW
jgi:hypothetical protein